MEINISPKTLTELRAFTAADVKYHPKIYLTDDGKEGEWVYDSTDTTSSDNIGTIIVTTIGGFRYKRKYKSNVYASWFIDTADTTGTSGNRERNAINRAVTFALAQTVCPTVILDNKRTWYVNNSAIYLDVATGKKIAIKGEGNPIIDFTCTSANEDGTSAVFRTSNSWSYPITAYNTANGTPVFTGSITGETLTITAVTSGSIKKGMRIYDATNSNIMPSTKITEFLTGVGGTGTYKINKTQTFSSGTITGQAAFLAWNNRTINTGKIEINGIIFDGNRNPANNGSNTIYSRPILLRQSEKVEISNCEFKNIPGSALAIGISDGITIKNNKFSSVFARNDWDNIGDAITIYAFCKNINVSDNKIELSDNQSGRCGISFDDFCKNGKVVNNEITGYERAIHIETSKNIVTANNTTERSPVGILSGGNEYCTIENNSIDGTDVVFPATLSATANLFVYYDSDCSYNNNIVVGTVTTQNSLYNSKFWGDKLSVRGNLFKNPKVVNDFTNSTTSTTSNTIGTGSKTFTYTSNPNLVWKLNQRLRIKNSTYVFVEGYITSVSSTSVTITVDLNSGSGTYTSWTLEYAPLGGVWGYGYNNDNVYERNVFEYANLQVDSNNNTVVKGNIFKSCAVTYSGESATRGVNGKIIENTFIPNAGETFSQGITVYNAVKPYVADNVLENPTEYVIQNTGSTGGVFENNTYIKTNVGAAGNGYFFVDSNLQDTNPTRTVKPNIIRDYVTSTLFYVDNHGVNYEIDYATPEMFGARVNDSTFNSGAAINAAIAFKKKVKLKAGTYYSTEKILINRNDFILEGEGKFNTVIQTKSGFSGSALVAVGSAAMQPYDVTIKNLRINANASGTGTNVSALEIDAQYNIDVDNCWMQGGDYNGTLTASVNVKLSKHLRFTSCNFTNGVSYGVMFSGAAYDDTMFNDCQFDENQVDIIVLSTGYIQRGNIIGCSFGQSYVNGSFPTPVVNKNIYAGTASTIDYLSVINCDFFSGVSSSTDNAIDILSPIQLRVSNSRFSNLKKYAIVHRDSGKLIISENSFINNGRSRANNTYTNATTNPDTSPYMTDVFSTTAFYGGSISDNITDQTVVGVVEIGGSTLADQNFIFSNNLVYSFGTLWGAANRNIGGNEINLKTGGSASNFLNEQGNYVSIAGGGDALVANPLSQFAATTSAQLASVISDETGTGSLVFANSPTLVTPNLGTPSAINLTNATSIPAGQLTGTIPSAVLGNSSVFIGTTSIALNRSSANQALTGILSVQLAGATSGTTTIQPSAIAGTTTITFPAVTGTVITTGDTSTVTNTMLAGSITNAKLANSTISGVALGSNLNALTIGTGLTGTSYNGSEAVSIAIDSTVVTLSGSQTLTNKTLTTPIISSISNSGTITIPTGTDTLVGRATTDTLTNKRITARVQSTTSTATFTFNFNSDDIGVITAQAAGLTVTTSGTPTSMQPFVLCIKDNGTARAITWNGIFVAIGVTLPTTTVVNKHTYVSGYYNTTAAKVHIVGVTTEA